MHADGGERDAQRHSDDALAAHVEAVRAEATHAGERAPPEVPGVVADEAEQEADEQQPIAVEEVLHDQWAEDQGDDHEDRGEDAAELRGPHDDRTAADALGAPVGERRGDLLFDREEEAGTGEEGDDPHHRQRRERVGTERPGGDGEEGVGRDAGDDEPRADGERSLGQRVGSQGGEAARRSSGDGLLLRFRVGVKHRSHARFRRHHQAWRERPDDGSATLTVVSDYDAVLVVSFGGPEGPDDVMPFLENVTRRA